MVRKDGTVRFNDLYEVDLELRNLEVRLPFDPWKMNWMGKLRGRHDAGRVNRWKYGTCNTDCLDVNIVLNPLAARRRDAEATALPR